MKSATRRRPEKGTPVPLIGDNGYVHNIDSVEERRLRAEEPEGLVLGFSWYEPPEHVGNNVRLATAGMIGTLLAAALIVGGLANQSFIALAGILLVPITLGVWAQGAMTKPKTTSLIVNGLTFRTDGQIRATDPDKAKIEGDAVTVHWFALKRTVDDIANIAMRPVKANSGAQYRHNTTPNDRWSGYLAWSIDVDFSTGERFTAGRYLNEDDGRIVNTQLNQALEKIRAVRDAGEERA